jgi:hypothetical protein
VRHAAASTASRPNVRDDGQRPSSGQDGGTSSFDLPDGESELFLQRGLDRILLICPSGKIFNRSDICPFCVKLDVLEISAFEPQSGHRLRVTKC